MMGVRLKKYLDHKVLSLILALIIITPVPVSLAYLTETTKPLNSAFSSWIYTLNYYENDGAQTTTVTNMPDPKKDIVSYTGKFDIASDIPKREGYIFKEWNTDAGGEGETVAPSTVSQTTTYTVSGNETRVNLYAIWESTRNQTADRAIMRYDPNTDAGLKNGIFSDPSTCFDAISEQNYSLIYDGDAAGVTGLPATQTYNGSNLPTNSHTFTLSDVVPVNQRYAFVGWSTQSNAETSEYGYVRGDDPSYELVTKHLEGKDQITVSGATKDTTLYAVWYYEYRLKYDVNGQGAIFGDSDGIMYTNVPNHSFRTSMTIPEREGYRFLGWATTPDATVAQYQTNEYIEPLQHGDDGYAEIRLYAVWQEE